MKSKDELKEIDIKNRRCYYFGDILRVIDIDFSDILLGKKSYEKVVLHVELIIIFQESELIRIILYLAGQLFADRSLFA